MSQKHSHQQPAIAALLLLMHGKAAATWIYRTLARLGTVLLRRRQMTENSLKQLRAVVVWLHRDGVEDLLGWWTVTKRDGRKKNCQICSLITDIYIYMYIYPRRVACCFQMAQKLIFMLQYFCRTIKSMYDNKIAMIQKCKVLHFGVLLTSSADAAVQPGQREHQKKHKPKKFTQEFLQN